MWSASTTAGRKQRPAQRKLPRHGNPFWGQRLRLEQLEDRRLLAVVLPDIPVWVPQGPAPIEHGYAIATPENAVVGAIQAVAVNPGDANTIYVGSVNGGIWKTADANLEKPHWISQTDAMPSLSISSIAFDPADASHNTLYAGTGTFSSDQQGQGTVGLLRTFDGGEHWQLIRKSFFENKRIVSVLPPPCHRAVQMPPRVGGMGQPG